MLTAEEYRRAEFDYTSAESRRGFAIHAVVYAVVMTGLIALNALLWVFADVRFAWAAFPLAGWGIGLTAHYVYGYRRAERDALVRQRNVEAFAVRQKTPV